MGREIHTSSTRLGDLSSSVERVCQMWDDALARNDVDGLAALYAPNAILESPLIPRLTGSETGVPRGRGAIRVFLEEVARREPPVRRHYRTRYFSDGRTLMWECPRATPTGSQMDLVEVMEINR